MEILYCLIGSGDLRGSALLLLSGLTSLLQDLEINTSVGSSQITQVVLEPQACVRAAHSWEFIFIPLIHTYRVPSAFLDGWLFLLVHPCMEDVTSTPSPPSHLAWILSSCGPHFHDGLSSYPGLTEVHLPSIRKSCP